MVQSRSQDFAEFRRIKKRLKLRLAKRAINQAKIGRKRADRSMLDDLEALAAITERLTRGRNTAGDTVQGF